MAKSSREQRRKSAHTDKLIALLDRIIQYEDAARRLSVLATKHCPAEHHDFAEIQQLAALVEKSRG